MPLAVLESLVQAWPEFLCQRDSQESLYPFLWAACSPASNLINLFPLLIEAPHVLEMLILLGQEPVDDLARTTTNEVEQLPSHAEEKASPPPRLAMERTMSSRTMTIPPTCCCNTHLVQNTICSTSRNY
mmetsp:Transcript_1728/g.3679  ORF Transcript_1728/g.3679 Transcript_1728/m.3679 type:complete len:129 (+) Transcript_1728:588-974(+)